MGIHKLALETFSRDLTIQPEISLPPLSFSFSLYLTLSLALHPSLPVRSCPPSHLSCNVYGPFCFCVLMTTVTESYPLPMRPDERCYPDALLTPLCPWPQRRCLASQLAASKEWGRGGPGGGGLRTCLSSCRQDAHTPPHPTLPPTSSLPSLSSQWKYGAGQHGDGDDVVINPEVLNSALAFHLNIYLHLNRHSEGPACPSRGYTRCPKGLM